MTVCDSLVRSEENGFHMIFIQESVLFFFMKVKVALQKVSEGGNRIRESKSTTVSS